MLHFSLPKCLQRIIPAAVLCAGLLASNTTKAQTPTYAYDPSTVANSNPPLAHATNNMAQYLFTPSDFAPSISTGVTITTIYVKAGNNKPAGTTLTDLNVKIGQTTLTNIVSGNWISGLTTVYNTPTTTISGWTAGTWIPITLQTPFTWNGTDNLIVELSQNGFTTNLPLQQGTVSGRNGRIFGSESNATSTNDDAKLISFGFDWGCTGTPSAPSITSTAFTLASPLCTGSTTTIAATDPNAPATGITYQWQSASSATGPWADVTTGTGGTTLSYTTGSITSDTYFRVGATCTVSATTTYSNSFLINVGAAQPGAITGNATFCPGDPANYSVPSVTGATYAWTLPPGWSGTSTSNVITVTPGSTGGTISVVATSSCGTSIAQTVAINTTGSAPVQPGNINGNVLVCGSATETYSVTPVAGATGYTWTLPSGWSGTSSTNSITVTTGTTGGNIDVTADDGCGSSTSRTLAVSVATVLANPGTITGSTNVCSGTVQGYSISPVLSATSYTWTLPSGWSGTTTGTSIQAIPGAASGNVTVTAYSACASSPTASLTVSSTATVTPAVTITSSASTVCEHTPVTFTATATDGGTLPQYQWLKNGVNASIGGTTYVDYSLTSSDIVTAVLTSSLGCVTSATATSNGITTTVIPETVPGININTTPTTSICAGTVLTFNTNITGGGTTPSYRWYKNGNAIFGSIGAGSTYMDGGLLDQDEITVELTTNAACPSTLTALSNKVVVSVASIVAPSVSISASSTILNGYPITFTAVETGGGATPSYQWIKNNVDISMANSNTYTATNLQNGDRIALKLLSSAPCALPGLVTSNEIILNSKLGIAAAGWDGTISMYPNPTTGRFSIAATWNTIHSGKRVTIDVMNAIGQNVYHREVAPDGAQWHADVQLTEGLANGSYILRLSGDGMRTLVPFVLNR